MPTSEQSQAVKPPRPAQLQPVHPPNSAGGDARSSEGESVAVQELDETIAHEAEALVDGSIEGEFDSVNDVLEGVFEDHPDAAAGTAAQAGDPAMAGADGKDRVEAAEFIPTSGVKTEERSSGEAAEISAAKAEPEAVAEPEPTLDEQPEMESKGEPEPERIPEARAALAESAPSRRAGFHFNMSWLMPVFSAVALVLSAPLRLVPPRLRPVVDLVALSLVFWVPIVWALAVLMSRR